MISLTNMLGRQAVRRFTTSTICRSGHHDPYEGVPGYNFPFSTQNRRKLLVIFMCYCASAFSIPFWIVRHHLVK